MFTFALSIWSLLGLWHSELPTEMLSAILSRSVTNHAGQNEVLIMQVSWPMPAYLTCSWKLILNARIGGLKRSSQMPIQMRNISLYCVCRNSQSNTKKQLVCFIWCHPGGWHPPSNLAPNDIVRRDIMKLSRFDKGLWFDKTVVRIQSDVQVHTYL